MKRRNQRTAIILIFSLLIGLFCQRISYTEPKAQASSYQLTEGEAVESYSVDLSGVNTATTGRALVIDGVDIFPQISDLKYYSSVNVSYELTFKDESKMEEELAKEEKKRREESGDDTISLGRDSWLFDMADLKIYVENKLGRRTYIVHEQTRSKKNATLPVISVNSENVSKYRFEIELNDYCSPAYWPVGVESARVTSITFIPYENARFGEPVVKPTATPQPENNLSQPQPPVPTVKDESYKSGKVENFSVNLDRYQTSFSKSWIYFDLRDAYGENWFTIKNYSAMRIRYQIDYFEEEEKTGNYESNEWYLDSIKYALVFKPDSLDGFSSDLYTCDYIHNPLIGTENTICIDDDFDVIRRGEPIVGINIQPMNKYCRWPQEIKRFTVIGIDFLARENAVYPSAPATSTTTQIQTITLMPSPTTGPIENKVEIISNLQAKVQNRRKINLSWTPTREADGYEIYRSTKKSSGFKKIATVAWNKDNFTDQKVKRNQTYYYKVRAYASEGNSRVYGPYSACRKQMVGRKAPSFTLKKKKTPQGISYISIHMKTWSDPNVEIRVRKKKKKYVKIPLTHPNIKKNKKVFNFQYSPGKKMWFQIRTYRKNKGKKQYSYTTTKRI